MTSILAKWHSRLVAMSECPWPGARPIRLEQHGRGALHLRNPDIRSIIRKIEDSDVVVVTGESGVGKSSLLSVGVVPQLEKRGFLAIPCNDWGAVEHLTEGATAGRRLVQAAMLRRLPFTVLSDVDFAEVMRELDDRYPSRVVVMLDQFEELLRYEPAAARDVLDWVQDVVASSSARVVLSLRAEYGYHVLGGLRLGAARLQHVQVDALTDDAIALAVVTRAAPLDESFIAQPAVKAITSAWKLASPYEVGLLHLQALMWSLWMTKQGDRIETSDVRKIIPATIDTEGANAAFSLALAVSVQISLDQCRDAGGRAAGSRNRTVDAVLESRAAGSIAGMILHLSNDGYKVNREREVLGQLALFSADHDIWDVAFRKAENALRALRSRVDDADDHGWLSVDRAELLPQSARVWPWDLDPKEQTAGPLMGSRPEDAVFESFRAYYFGLEWLRASSIVRISRTARSHVMVSLVHDGFAEGLNRWRQGQRLGLAELTTRLVATRGQSFAWPTRPEQTLSERRMIHSNLRIQHSEINGCIANTTFVNCDFKGTLFQDCTFEGVTFVNCILDDVQLTRCATVGTPMRFDVEPDVKNGRRVPGYIVPASAPHVRSIGWYRGIAVASLELHSATAGLPALPVESLEHAVDADSVPTGGGGLSIIGGRISSLKFRQCEFFDDGEILISQAAGTSVEFADQEQLRLHCDAVTLRALTFTTPLTKLTPLPLPPTNSGLGAQRNHTSFRVDFDDALVCNIWFSQGMRGEINFANCLVWQLFNAGDDRLVINFSDESGFVGLVNVASARNELDAPSKVGLGTAAERVDFARSRIDYRAHPTDDELLELRATIERVSPSFFPTN